MSSLPERRLVLVVEDDRAGRVLFAEWLQQGGFRVERSDASRTDLDIPRIDGYEMTRRSELIAGARERRSA